MANTRVIGNQSVIDFVLYDFVTEASSFAAHTDVFFTDTLGSGLQISPLAVANTLPANWTKFDVTGIGIKFTSGVFSAASSNGFLTAVQDASYQVTVGQTPIKFGHLTEFLNVVGSFKYTSANTSSIVAIDPSHMQNAYLSLSVPITIPALTYFDMQIVWNTVSTAFDSAVVGVFFKGLLYQNIYG